ncbi:MAG: S-layer homology domain-containing protein [Clostridia bacterium]|nr:S-layer homology domain-containing protein [Clostridia bacterium]
MKRKTASFLGLLLIFSSITVSAADSDTVNAIVSDAAEYVYKTTGNPQVGSTGGEWAVIGLARSGAEVPAEYFENYYQTVEKYVKDCRGVLHDRKYTEYSRVILALTAIGKNPADVAGYNLLKPLGDYEKTIWQGINGPIWALLALDSGSYEIPGNAGTLATREMYINNILENRTADGGWTISGDVADPDITGMALQALAKYQDNESVKAATEKALLRMSEIQCENGGFSSRGTENSESCVQMITALCELGIPIDDERFVKNGNTMLDNLLTYYTEGKGFKHTHEESGSNQMATEQGLYCMAAIKRAIEGKSSLYRMSDAARSDNTASPVSGLAGKNPDVRGTDIVSPGKTFADISGHLSRTAIEALSARNIINGKSENSFEPDSTMTRAEFAAIVVRGLGLPIKSDAGFADVTENDWFYEYVNTAYFYNITSGISETEFNPNGTITREEAAVMVTRAAELCGADTEIDAFAARDILAGFFDYVKASDWAIGSLAFCYDKGILPDDAEEIKPKEAVTRAEIAQMLFNMLSLSNLIQGEK